MYYDDALAAYTLVTLPPTNLGGAAIGVRPGLVLVCMGPYGSARIAGLAFVPLGLQLSARVVPYLRVFAAVRIGLLAFAWICTHFPTPARIRKFLQQPAATRRSPHQPAQTAGV